MPVNLHLQVQGTRRIISALTDASGNFSTIWQPLPGEAGLYRLAAAHPGYTNPAPQDGFSLYGMEASPRSLNLGLIEHGLATNTVEVRNLGDLPLNGLTVSVVNNASSWPVTVSLKTNALAGLATNLLTCVVGTPSSPALSGSFVVRVTSSESATVDVPVRVDVQSLVPRLVAQPTELVAGMRRGFQTLVSLRVANTGGAASGPVTVSLPAVPWMTLASPNPQPSIEPGATNVITLRLAPPADLALGSY